MNMIQAGLKKLWQEDDGLGTLEILLIVAVLVALAVIFRKWIVHWFNLVIGNANADLTGSTDKPCDPSSGACTP